MEDAIASVVITMENGSSVEVGLIGREGVVCYQSVHEQYLRIGLFET
jgi:hypothetical protein